MSKDAETELLLKKHEELVSFYIHQNKIEWNLISIYVALNVGLATVIAALIQRTPTVVFLCLLGTLSSFFGAKLFQRHQKQASKWVREGIKVEKALEKVLTFELFEMCEKFSKKKPKIQNGMWTLTIIWFIVTVGTILVKILF